MRRAWLWRGLIESSLCGLISKCRNRKANRLEIYTTSSEGLQLMNSRTVYGKITILEKIRPLESEVDHLLIGTDRSTYFTASWDNAKRQLRTEKSFVDQADKSFRDAQSQDRCLVDPTQSFIALLLFEGIVTILPVLSKFKRKVSIEQRGIGDPVPIRISDLFVRSFAFLHSRGAKDRHPHKIAFLYEDNHQKACLSIRVLDYTQGMSGESDSAALEVLDYRDDLELGASHLIAVPAPACKNSWCNMRGFPRLKQSRWSTYTM